MMRLARFLHTINVPEEFGRKRIVDLHRRRTNNRAAAKSLYSRKDQWSPWNDDFGSSEDHIVKQWREAKRRGRVVPKGRART